MESQPTFVRPDGAIHLDPESPVHMKLALIVLPWNAEHDDSLRFDNSFEDFCFSVFRMLVHYKHERLGYFLDGLVEFGFRGVLRLNMGHQRCDLVIHGSRRVCQIRQRKRSKILKASNYSFERPNEVICGIAVTFPTFPTPLIC